MVKVATYFGMTFGAFLFWQSMDKVHVWIALHQDEKDSNHFNFDVGIVNTNPRLYLNALQVNWVLDIVSNSISSSFLFFFGNRYMFTFYEGEIGTRSGSQENERRAVKETKGLACLITLFYDAHAFEYELFAATSPF
ncbi:hypothetical protein QQ045_019397 [Rhodiola kirilowii]